MTKRIYRITFWLISGLGVLLATELLQGTFNSNFLYMYTNLSNLVVFGFVSYMLYATLKNKPYVRHYYIYKFVITIMILVTMIIYNLLLGDITSPEYWTVRNVIIHLLTPLLMAVDWFVFDQKGQLKIHVLAYSLVIPYVYVIYAFIRGAITNDYPYFFLDVNDIGYQGVLKWVFYLTIGFLVLSLGLYAYDHYQAKKLIKAEAK